MKIYSLFEKFIQRDLIIWGNSRHYFFLGFTLSSTGSLAADTSTQASNSNIKQTHADFIHSETLDPQGLTFLESCAWEGEKFLKLSMDPLTVFTKS